MYDFLMFIADRFIIVIILVSVVLAGFAWLLLKLRGQKKQLLEKEGEYVRQRHRAEDLEKEISQLAKYRAIRDAESKAAEILLVARERLEKAIQEARDTASKIVHAAETEKNRASAETSAMMDQAKQEVKSAKDEARSLLDSSILQASQIVEEAKSRAKEIAGDALETRDKAALYENTARAMKNLINGYGDQYIVPGHSLLDDLAEEFGFTQAGEALKRARDVTKAMIRIGTAAKCDYVEANRKDTAIAFVIDAFNGKVDSILSRVKHDNFGTLAQEIRDALAVVNYNGKAFREARITEEYLAARLDELKWASVAQQLKLEEREEQRRIKDQLREEEKARREYERAIRDAAKEEELIHKAMEKAQQQIEKANAEQRTKYEQQLAELTLKLKDAEERNQRALSMAQQTKRGHVYIISNIGSFGEDTYKIGLTRRLEPLDRVRELGDSSVPFAFDVHALILADDAPALEAQLHNHFILQQINKVNHRKEFFRASLKEIREEIDKLGISVKWTMMAEAREWRESLAIEKSISENPAAKEAWMKRQFELDISASQCDEDAILNEISAQ